MSLKPTAKNHAAVGIAYSARGWATHAIGGDKVEGGEGFERFTGLGGWHHPMHYKHIGTNPSFSSSEALEEMGYTRERLISDIMHLAKQLDEGIMRLARMERQINDVIDNHKEP